MRVDLLLKCTANKKSQCALVSTDQTILFWVAAWMQWTELCLVVSLQANCFAYEVQWQKKLLSPNVLCAWYETCPVTDRTKILKIFIHQANMVEQWIIQIKSEQNNYRADKNTCVQRLRCVLQPVTQTAFWPVYTNSWARNRSTVYYIICCIFRSERLWPLERGPTCVSVCLRCFSRCPSARSTPQGTSSENGLRRMIVGRTESAEHRRLIDIS